MANKKRKDAIQAPRQMTRGQLSRHQRELQQLRQLYLAMAAVVALIVLVLGSSLLNTYVLKPNAQVGKVNDQTITRAMYNKYRAWTIYNNLRLLSFYSQQSGQTSTQTSQYQTQIAQGQAELVALNNSTALDGTTLQQLADNLLLEQKAGDLGVSVTDAEILASAQKNFEPQPTPIPGPSATPGPTNTPGTPTATGTPATATATPTGTPPTDTPTVTGTATQTPTPGPSPTLTRTPTVTSTPLPVPGAQLTAVVDYKSFIQAIAAGPQPSGSTYCQLGCPGLSEQDYLSLVARPIALKDKATTKLAAKVPTTQEQVHAQHILVADEATAKMIKTKLDQGASFAALAAQYSTDTSNKDKGGDLGWFAATENGGPMVKEFSDAAFALKAGQTSGPVKSQFGWHIIHVIERGQQPLSSTDLDTAKTKAYTDWLNSEKAKSTITLNIPATPTPVPTVALPTVAPSTPAADTTPITGTVPLSGTVPAGTAPPPPVPALPPVTSTLPLSGTGSSGTTPTAPAP